MKTTRTYLTIRLSEFHASAFPVPIKSGRDRRSKGSDSRTCWLARQGNPSVSRLRWQCE
jgi:hypothetical protein